VAVYDSDVLRPTRENQALLEAAYRAGKIDLPSLLLVRNQLREAELGYWDAWLALRLARVRLEAATGISVAGLRMDGEVAR
jgi:outer membrane protein TolC